MDKLKKVWQWTMANIQTVSGAIFLVLSVSHLISFAVLGKDGYEKPAIMDVLIMFVIVSVLYLVSGLIRDGWV